MRVMGCHRLFRPLASHGRSNSVRHSSWASALKPIPSVPLNGQIGSNTSPDSELQMKRKVWRDCACQTNIIWFGQEVVEHPIGSRASGLDDADGAGTNSMDYPQARSNTRPFYGLGSQRINV